MSKRKLLWDVLSDEQKQEAIEHVIAWFLDEREETVGMIAAEEVLDMVMDRVFPAIYNKALEDARKLIESKASDTVAELDLLRRS